MCYFPRIYQWNSSRCTAGPNRLWFIHDDGLGTDGILGPVEKTPNWLPVVRSDQEFLPGAASIDLFLFFLSECNQNWLLVGRDNATQGLVSVTPSTN